MKQFVTVFLTALLFSNHVLAKLTGPNDFCPGQPFAEEEGSGSGSTEDGEPEGGDEEEEPDCE